MALIKCDECGKEISNKSKICINCGAPIKKESKNNIIFPIISIALGTIVISVLLFLINDISKTHTKIKLDANNYLEYINQSIDYNYNFYRDPDAKSSSEPKTVFDKVIVSGKWRKKEENFICKGVEITYNLEAIYHIRVNMNMFGGDQSDTFIYKIVLDDNCSESETSLETYNLSKIGKFGYNYHLGERVSNGSEPILKYFVKSITGRVLIPKVKS